MSMAREKVKGFDADKFIESVRESAVPTYHTASDGVKTAEKNSRSESSEVKDQPLSCTETKICIEDDRSEKFAALNLVQSEIDFVKAYVVSNNFTQVNKNGKPVFIREKFRKIIIDLLNTLDETPNLSGYIDNVLAEHFNKFYSTIRSIARKCPPKF